MSEASILAIVVTYNSADQISKCLSSLAESRLSTGLEVIVVDNASSDDSLALVQSGFPWVHTIANSCNVGFGAACNQALQGRAPGMILLLNPDAELEPDTLRCLGDYLQRHPQVGIVGPRLVNLDGAAQTSASHVPSLWGTLLYRTIGTCLLFRMSTLASRLSQWAEARWGLKYCRAPVFDHWKTQSVGLLAGAVLLIRAAAGGGARLFNEDYFLYSEDDDLCHRIRQQGWDVVYVGSAEARHLGAASTANASEFREAAKTAGRLMFYRKHRSLAAYVSYRGISIMTTLLHLIMIPLVAPFGIRRLAPPLLARLAVLIKPTYEQARRYQRGG